jgi:hypothetical protein
MIFCPTAPALLRQGLPPKSVKTDKFQFHQKFLNGSASGVWCSLWLGGYSAAACFS